VSAPLIAECYANLECKVVDTREVNRYFLFVLEVVKAWIEPAKKHPHYPPHGQRILHGRRRNHQTAFAHEVAGTQEKGPSKSTGPYPE